MEPHATARQPELVPRGDGEKGEGSGTRPCHLHVQRALQLHGRIHHTRSQPERDPVRDRAAGAALDPETLEGCLRDPRRIVRSRAIEQDGRTPRGERPHRRRSHGQNASRLEPFEYVHGPGVLGKERRLDCGLGACRPRQGQESRESEASRRRPAEAGPERRGPGQPEGRGEQAVDQEPPGRDDREHQRPPRRTDGERVRKPGRDQQEIRRGGHRGDQDRDPHPHGRHPAERPLRGHPPEEQREHERVHRDLRAHQPEIGERIIIETARLFAVTALAVLLCALAPGAGLDALQAQSANSLLPGDLIRVQIWREEDLSGDFQLDEDGVVVLPLLGAKSVTGISPDHLRDQLTKEYGDYLVNTAVNVTLLRRIAVLGEVRVPGVYTIDATNSVADVIARAQGVTPEGDAEKIDLVRGGRTLRTTLTGTEILQEADIRSGDQIIVGRRSWLSRNFSSLVGAASLLANIAVLAFK